MRKIAKLILPFMLVLIVSAGQLPFTASAAPDYKVVGYVYGTPGNIDATRLTHINYAFASIVNGQVYVANPGDLSRLVSLKSVNPNLKVLLAVGGWGAEGFSDAALTEASRTAFANSCLSAINNNNLDGIDLDWEYPVNGGWGVIKGRPEDKQNFTLLLNKIRSTIGAGKLLTIAGGAGMEYVNNTELNKIANICDFINIMTYDFGSSTHNANLYNTNTYSPGISADSAVRSYISSGVPASKIVLGVPFYGRTGGSWPTYDELVNNYINKNGWVRHWDDQAKACYLLRQGEFLTYDDVETFGHKTAYIKQNGLGGVMFWQYKQDSSGTLLGKLWSDLNGGGTSTVATPVFSPGGGTYSSAQSVTISCATSGATIRYTTNGSDPTSSSAVYTGPITVSSTTTVRARAFRAGMSDSAVASATYTIGVGNTSWAPNTAYRVGDIVTYDGRSYRCIQAHTSLTGWEPPIVPALWQAL